MMRYTRTLLLGLALTLISTTEPEARTWHVSADGLGEAPTIQAAIDSCAAGDVVELACGTYTTVDGIGEDIWLIGERPVCFALKTGVTVRSASGNPECVTVDAGGQGGVAFCSGRSDCVIEGITITNGFATTIDGGNGGGVYCTSSTLVLRDCIIAGNRSPRYGGGLFVFSAGVDIINCRIEDNEAASGGGGGFFSDVRLRVEDTAVARNRVSDVVEGFGGGGFCILNSRPLSMANCSFVANSISQSGGGALFIDSSTGAIAATLLAENSARWGGALHFPSLDDLSFADCTIRDNTATEWGGGVVLGDQGYGFPRFINTDFRRNNAPVAPQGYLMPSSFVVFECCVIDLDLWEIHGAWLVFDEDCAVGTQNTTWGGVKTMFR
jgi:hypothetical protein